MRLLWLTLLAAWSVGVGAATIVYPQPEAEFDARTGYPLRMLTLALAQSGESFELQPTTTVMQQGRALRQLALGREVDVVWSVTSAEREKYLRPIRIPIYKGLIGWRLLMIRSGDQAKFQMADSGQLRRWFAGQGHDWPDLGILKANGFTVVPSSTYEGLFEMLINGRIDYLPRSATEIQAEEAVYQSQGLAIEKSLLMRYPAALYFFVNRDNEPLAQRIEQGLERLIANGQFDRLFHETFDRTLQRLAVDQRRVIELTNPQLPPSTPLSRLSLWHQPSAPSH